MGWKCTPQVIGLVRGEPKAGQKHRANGLKILQESGNERFSKSETLDRTRSTMNEYEGFESGKKAWEHMCNDAETYRTVGKTKDGKPYERALRHDAVIGWSVIFNPPADACADWDDSDYKKFYNDSFECLCEIEPRVFRSENVVQSAEHHDEGLPNEYGEYSKHQHKSGFAKDENGKYCGNLIDAKLMVKINEKYPAMMRDRGWDMEDLDTTDFKRAKTDPAYRAERNAKRKQSGKSTNKYIVDVAKATAEAYHGADEAYEDALEYKKAARHEQVEANKTKMEAERDARKLVEVAKDQSREIIAQGQLEAQKAVQRAREALEREKEEIRAEREQLRKKTAVCDGLIAGLKNTKLRSGKSYYDMLTEDRSNRSYITRYETTLNEQDDKSDQFLICTGHGGGVEPRPL